MEKSNKLAVLYQKLKRRSLFFVNFCVVLLALFLTPLLLKCPVIKWIVRYLLSVSDDQDYKVAYVQILSTLAGSFLAIWGALWTQRRIDDEKEKAAIRKHARIVYHDLNCSFVALKKMIQLVHVRDHRQFNSTDFHESIDCFSRSAVMNPIKINNDWIPSVAELGDYISRYALNQIYQYYGKLIDISDAMNSGDPDRVAAIFMSHIYHFIDYQAIECHPDIVRVLNEVEKLTHEISINIKE